MAASDIDVTTLTDSVAGYFVSRQTPARSPLEPLAGAFFFDGVESDDVLAFRKRGAAPAAALTQADLIAADADIISDFGAVPASLSVIVHQLGAFGRGFPRTVTLEIT